jgi:AAA+ ATPase superfamily predicted ATPase
MFSFWYTFVPDNMSLIELGYADIVWDRIASSLPDYMGKVWEEISLQWMWREVGKGRFADVYFQLGNWWGTDKVNKKEVEIDILGIANQTYYFAECKWRKEKTGRRVLLDLQEKARLFHDKVYHKFLIFSRSDFTEDMLSLASEDVILVSLDEFFNECYNERH